MTDARRQEAERLLERARYGARIPRITRPRLWDLAMSLLEHIEDGTVTEDEVISAVTNADNLPWNADNATWLRENFKALWAALETGESEGKPSWTTTGPPYLRETKP
jgi:hypothetical protein